ncbi:phosphopyruvate hydratase [Campylobacter canadensis]|uniref:Enolase n=1 Tax=Campylobacter canadensis TaxID=449520 RepID=A0ABS7WQQ4_9BACT|nr:phosphopyruvate hydratase [Campylobacter canadensis]MBZ7986632.1 phosphopyruvate hydratase [Campylobacter canadensis]MBZ7993963.1 phosphopyruvate hydratase [Campylobacter canadensis]MBZ7996279.1 phosphopyruvate hydratase [Campylobacter canadensis]MBZ7997668.1 phosphopyruvate hydratase [Campylobacter canadensis]MBZ7999295.1 phosphopyruvate hydratase [Campylobacter canadensis]
MKIAKIDALEVLDSRANPTVKVIASLDNGLSASAIVPSGASTGINEALELRDGTNEFFGKRVQKAVNNVKALSAGILGLRVDEQRLIDEHLLKVDGTSNYSSVGANATLGISMAIAKLAAKAHNLALYEYLCGQFYEFPTPMLNVLNGGAHADNNIDIQEFMLLPTGFESFKEKLFASAITYHTLKNILKQKGLNTALGDEGGFAPNLSSNEEAIELLLEAINKAGFSGKISLALDVASSEFYKDGFYTYENDKKSYEQMSEIYEKLVNKYPILSIEDALAEEDYEGWKHLSAKLKNKVQLVGDDLFVTNVKLLQKGIDEGLANAILIKPNQIGTISQTIDAITLAKKNNYNCIMSHRSGESEDSFIADFSMCCKYIKTGAPARGERTAKYNRLLEIEHLCKSF